MSKGTANSLNIIIVERTGTLKSLAIKDFKEEELFKKCGFKKADGFNKQTEWNVKMDGNKYTIRAYAKDDGRANSENKYDFPPPIDTKLFFGSCALVALTPNDKGEKSFCDLSLILWNKIYEKLFGGFEDLATTAAEDEAEEDELANVPKEKKTKQGYLKDGFVVDSSDDSEEQVSNYDDNSNDSLEEEDGEDEDSSDDEEEADVIVPKNLELDFEEYD
jgi:hypothetical protein